MNSTCPGCGTTYRIDPEKVPSTGVRARCAHCETVFRVSPPAAESQSAGTAARVPESDPTPSAVQDEPLPELQPSSPTSSAPPLETHTPSATPPPAFGVADPHSKARRLARALISDIVVYHPERRDGSLRNGTLRQEFREEIRKSWEEYVTQVGDSLARGTPYFREALNEILAGGQQVF